MNDELAGPRTVDLAIGEDLHGRRLDQALARLLPQSSRAALQGLIRDGRVALNGAAVSQKTKVSVGDAVRVNFPAVRAREDLAEAIALDILHQDEDVIVLDKPAGLVVHPGAGNADGTLMNALLHHDRRLGALPRAGIVHRLDKDTSGVMVVARNEAARRTLVDALGARQVHRSYRAVCAGRMIAGGTVDAPIGRHRVNRLRMAVTSAGREAVSHYRVMERFTAHTHVEVELETGRTHQIRVHMAHIGHALVGDGLYAGRSRLPAGVSDAVRDAVSTFPRQALHAVRLQFEHPRDGKTVSFDSPLPADFEALLARLRDAGE